MKRKSIFQLAKVLVSITILYVIFRRIDFDVLLHTFRKANIFLLLLGLLIGYILQIVIGGLRWYYIVKTNFKKSVIFSHLFKIFWEGMFFGYFLPASIGWDVYRVIEGRKLGVPAFKNVIVIIWEKFFGMAATILLFLISVPFFKSRIIDSNVFIAINNLWLALVVLSLIIGILAIVVVFIKQIKFIINKILLGFERIIEKLFAKLLRLPKESIKKENLLQNFLSIFNFKGIVFFALSLLIKILPAISTVLFFYAIDIEVKFSVSVFATVLIIFIHMLPISFGSIGVREGAFIIVFGFFGIAAEEALAVSFFGFFSLIFTVLLGGGSLLFSNTYALIKMRGSK